MSHADSRARRRRRHEQRAGRRLRRRRAPSRYGVERELLPDSPADGIVEFDARAMADTCLELAAAALEHAGPVDAVGISNQRGSTVVWDRATGEPVGPGIGWQDLRTIGACLSLRGAGRALEPEPVRDQAAVAARPAPRPRPRAATSASGRSTRGWRGRSRTATVHVTDATNAAVTGLQVTRDPSTWDADVLAVLGIPPEMLPTIVDSSGVVGDATALAGAPPIAALLGDQQASLVGPGLRAAGRRQDHVRHRRDARPRARRRRRRRSTSAARRARSRSWRGATTGASRGASRRSCSRPAPTCSGCATTSA